jgi:hypothetical protein
MDDSTAILIGLAVIVVVFATVMFFVIPEPSHLAVVSTDRLDLAVLTFRNSSSWDGAGETVRARVESALVNEPGISVFSRSELDSLLAEQMMSETGIIDEATSVKIGSLTGVSKLVTGIVDSVEKREEPTTVCLNWVGGTCSQEGKGTRYSLHVSAQVSVVDTKTGRIEYSLNESGSDSVTLPVETRFQGYDRLLANAASQIADSVTSSLSETYTRELRYGLYADYKVKGEGFLGRDESSRFSASDGEIYLIVHATHVQTGELFDIEWMNESSGFDQRVEDVLSNGDWRLYALDVSQLSSGRYAVHASLNGTEIFTIPFTIAP